MFQGVRLINRGLMPCFKVKFQVVRLIYRDLRYRTISFDY